MTLEEMAMQQLHNSLGLNDPKTYLGIHGEPTHGVSRLTRTPITFTTGNKGVIYPPDPAATGLYDPDTKTITINPQTAGDIPETIRHEVTHANLARVPLYNDLLGKMPFFKQGVLTNSGAAPATTELTAYLFSHPMTSQIRGISDTQQQSVMQGILQQLLKAGYPDVAETQRRIMNLR